MFDQRFAFPTPSSLCRAQRVKTPPWLGRGQNRGHFLLVLHLLELRTPQSTAAISRMSLLAGPGWWGGTLCPVAPAAAATGTAAPAAPAVLAGPAAALAPALLHTLSQPAVGTGAVPRGWQRLQPGRCAQRLLCDLSSSARPTPRALRGHRIPTIVLLPSLPTLPGTRQRINNKGNQWNFKKIKQKNPKKPKQN